MTQMPGGILTRLADCPIHAASSASPRTEMSAT